MVLDTGHYLGHEYLIWRKTYKMNDTTVCVPRKGYIYTQLGHFLYKHDLQPVPTIIYRNWYCVEGKNSAVITKTTHSNPMPL